MKLSEAFVRCIIPPMLESDLAYCGADVLRKRSVPGIVSGGSNGSRICDGV
jgi:hypothetical protein